MAEVIVLIEHYSGGIKPTSLNAITAAKRFGEKVSLLVLGNGLQKTISSLKAFDVGAILVVDHQVLTHPLADTFAAVIASVMQDRRAQALVAGCSTFSKDILPRVAALLDAPMISDVVAFKDCDQSWEFCRPIYAGRTHGTFALHKERVVFTVRAPAFQIATPSTGNKISTEEILVEVDALSRGMEFVSKEETRSERPDLLEARVVVSGGRPLKDSETFERLIGGLADVFHGAVACTRAAVDEGIAPNDCQVGQTGKVIAPELYIGVGVSGAIQHLAGVKDSKIIVAINKDPEAPIFQWANYGLVGDLYEIVPGLIKAFTDSY